MSKPMLRCDSRAVRALLALTAAAAAASVTAPVVAQTDLSTVPLPTYSTGSTTDVKPNILFVLDDSGSMDWNFLPDWANSTPPNYSSRPDYLFRNSAYNGIYYNPAITYLPPIRFNTDGTRDTTTYPSQTGQTNATGASSATKPNWAAVKNDAYGIQSTSTSNLTTNAYYWISIPGEFCNSPALTDCTATTTPSGNYAYPAPLRWCDSSALTNCRGLQNTTFNVPRIPAPRVATIGFSGSNNASVTGITVDGLQILSAATAASGTSTTVADRVEAAINACRFTQTGNCTTVGYWAVASGATVTILAPGTTSASPVVNFTGTTTVTTTAFARSPIPLSPWRGTASTNAVPGETLFVSITPSVTSYPYPGTNAKAASRTDCAGTTCTYAEEMTNFANWWTYYRTRMQMMKTSTARAFAVLDSDADQAADRSRFRVGYMSINNNTTTDFVNLGEFNTAQKITWYSKLFAANPDNSTPLRQALSQAGRLYAGKFNDTDFNGVRVTDPMQYSCQRNFTILSTDGYWNGNAGTKLDGSTAIGNQDGLLPRPYNDGAVAQIQTRTSQLQSRTVTQRAERGELQSRTVLQERRTSQLQQLESRLESQTSQLQRRRATAFNRFTSTDGGVTWTGPTSVTTCDPVASGSPRVRCEATSWPATWTDVSSCNVDYRTECQYADGPWQSASSCDPESKSPGPTSFSRGVARACRYVDGTWTNTGSCTLAAKSSGTGNWTRATARDCRYLDDAWAPAQSCNAVAKDNSSPFDVGLATECRTSNPAWVAAASCSPTGFGADGNRTECRYNWGANAVATQTCTPTQPTNDFSNAVVWRNCGTTNGTWTNATSCTATSDYDGSGVRTECQYDAWTSWSNVGSCSAAPRSAAPTYTVGLARECQSTSSGGNSNTLADVAAYYYNTDLRSPTATGADATGTCDGPIIPPSTTRTNLCNDNVPAIGRNTNTRQHMVTHGLALGAQGMMVYSPYQNSLTGQRVYVPDYWSQPSGDFYDVTNGTSASPSTGICPWQTSGACNWPTPSADSAANIDDLWHAAVNGQGTYFSARDPVSLAESLRAVLNEIIRVPRPGTAAAAATSNPNVTTADNFVFSSSYLSLDWYGELVMQRIGTNGRLGAQEWSAMQLLDCATTAWRATRAYAPGDVYKADNRCWVVHTGYTSGASFGSTDYGNVYRLTGTPVTRNIYTVSAANALVSFDWASLDTTQRAMFTRPAINLQSATAGLTQFCSVGAKCLLDAAKTSAEGEALVNFLRGDRTNEGTYYRTRKRILGDIVSSEARYVRVPLQNYADAGYADFKTAMATRAPTVYVGSNDGMLHAFDANTGTERWAFVPPAVLPEMYRLADVDYTTKRRYFVDGTPEVGDICPTAPATACTGAQWRTILVGGLNLGGKAFYAMDITDPANPRYLWQFTNANLGYSYSNPRITKLKNGQWVVIVASGYDVADGVGRLFVLNASTGALLHTISTGVGTTTAEAGLARITARAPTAATNNTTEAVYAGDLLGNVWRFDVNDDVGASGRDAQLLVQLRDAANNPQPVTVRPVITTINAKPVVIVGTGRYLGLGDLTTTGTQSVYAIKDNLDSATLTTPRTTGSNFVRQTITDTVCPTSASTTVCSPNQIVRTASTNVVDWGTRNGWYLDLPLAGERSVSDHTLALGTLAFTTIIPQTSTSTVPACTADSPPSAKSYLYYLDYSSGGAIAGGNSVAGVFVADGVATRVSVFRNTDGTLRAVTRISGLAPGAGAGDGTGSGTADESNSAIRNCDNCISTDMAGRDERELLTNTGGGGTPQRRSWRILNGDN
jgi:type IV pilus assembly protein PilY1